MKFVVLKKQYEPSFSLERKVVEAKNLNQCIRKYLKGIDLSRELIATYDRGEQIRIPEEIYRQIKPEIQKILRDNSRKPDSTFNIDNRWLNENYWAPCKAYIFNFDGIEVSVGVEWGYEGEENSDYNLFITEMKHPFVGEFLGCGEGRWEEFGEKENIKKWLK